MSGCHAGELTPAATVTVAQTQPTQETTEPVPSTEAAEESTEATTESTAAPAAHTTEQHTTDETVPETTVPQNTAPKETQPKETQSKETDPPATEATTPTETVPVATEPPATEPPATEAPVTEPPETEPPETEGATEPGTIEINYEYKRQVAAYAAQYINQYRGSPCTVLPGMSQVAQYRAGQLCYNFSHSTSDKRAALAYYEYGRWIDATEAGLDASLSYYESDTSEAICRGVRGMDAEALGKAIADAIRASGSHWSYVGSSEYSYIGVGVEYRDDAYGWYCCVMVGTVNYG